MRAGGAAYQQGDYAAATRSYSQAVSRRPDDADALNNLAQVLARAGHPDQAIPYLDRAIGLDPQRWAFTFNRAHVFGQLHDWARAIVDYRAAAALFPHDYATQYNLGLALQQAGDDAGAVEALRLAVDLAPGEPSFDLALAPSYERLGRRVEAAETYRHFLRLSPGAPQRSQVLLKIRELTGWPEPVGDQR